MTARAALRHLLARHITDGPHESPEFLDEGVPFLSVDNVVDGRLSFEPCRFISEDDHARFSEKVKPVKGDVLITKAASVGRVACVDVDLEFNVWSPIAILRPRPDALTQRYLYYFLQSLDAQAQLQRGATSNTQQNIAMGDIASLLVPTCPLAEQRAIADYLDAETARIDALIAKKRQLFLLLEERRAGLMIAGVTGELTHSGPVRESGLAWARTVPDHWDVALLRLVTRQGTGHTPSRTHPEWWAPDECVVPWVTTGEVKQVRSDRVRVITETRERISHLGIANSSAEIHPRGTVFLCRTASAGYSGIMGEDMATSQDFATWTCGDRLDPEFLLFCLRAMRADLLGRLATGSTHKTIYMPDIQALKIPAPPIQEQRQISAVLKRHIDRSFKMDDTLRRQIELLVERRQALITAAVAGNVAISSSRRRTHLKV